MKVSSKQQTTFQRVLPWLKAIQVIVLLKSYWS